MKAGISAVTMTTATFLAERVVGGTLIPYRRRRLAIVCWVYTGSLSPWPASPATRPYPTSWLSRAPETIATSRTRTPAAGLFVASRKHKTRSRVVDHERCWAGFSRACVHTSKTVLRLELAEEQGLPPKGLVLQ